MKRVTGVGGIFLRCENPGQLLEWYNKHPGISVVGESGVFEWKEKDKPNSTAHTVFGVFPDKTKYFKPSKKTGDYYKNPFILLKRNTCKFFFYNSLYNNIFIEIENLFN